MIHSQPLMGFYAPWATALAGASLAPPATPSLVDLGGGVQLPIVQLVLAVAGVLMARPLAKRGAEEGGWSKSLSVTGLMLLVALAWVAESRPSPILTIIVSMGLGFSGYSLVEIAGDEVKAAFKRVLRGVGALLSAFKIKEPKE